MVDPPPLRGGPTPNADATGDNGKPTRKTRSVMATPTASASFNKAAYALGEVITLTINHADADRSTLTVTVTVKDEENNVSAPATATAVIDDGVVTFTNTGGKVWTLQTATRDQSVYTTTA